MRRLCFVGLVIMTFVSMNTRVLNAQDLVLPEKYPAYTIEVNDGPDDGYVFMTTRAIANKAPASLIAIDNYGTPIYYKHLPEASGGFSLNMNGLLTYRTGERFYMMDSSYVIVDSVWMKDFDMDGHDFLALENGHFIIFGSDYRTVDLTSYGGVVDATVEGCVIQELDADKNVVFEWNSWDHYSVEDTYKDMTASSVEIVHPNSLAIDYDGAILLVARAMDEVTKISRETGEIVWRLGGKNNQFQFTDTTQMFSMPHDFRPSGNGNYTIHDNGNDRIPPYSRGLEYKLDIEAMTCEIVWEYDANKEVLGKTGGSTRRLENGNYIIGYGGKVSQPACVEVHPDGSKAFQLNFVEKLSSGRSTKYPWRTNLFEPNTYAVNFGEWDGYTESEYILNITNNSDGVVMLTGYSVRTSAFTIDEAFPIEIPANGNKDLTIVYYPQDISHGYIEDVLTIDSDINSDTLIQRISQQVALKGTLFDDQAPHASLSVVQEHGDTITKMVLAFNEPIFKLDGNAFSYSSVDELITFRKTDENGADLVFDAVINSEMNSIIVFPKDTLARHGDYYFALSDQYQDKAENQGGELVEVILYSKDELIENNALPIRVYPNPGDGLFDFELSTIGTYMLKLFAMNGSLLVQGRVDADSKGMIDLRTFESGQYILFVKELISGEETSTILIKK